jgi:carboxymethylenebutenolidase
MHKLLLPSISFLLGILGFVGQYNETVSKKEIISCHPLIGADENMNVFAEDPDFIALHHSPKKISYSMVGEMVVMPAPDGVDAKAYFIKAKTKSDKWLFVYQEWWGLNDNIKNQADIFYKDLGENVNVLALDMYDGKATADPKEAGQLMQSCQESRLENIVKAALQYAGENAKIANVGWCFGGGWSLKSALLCGLQNVGIAMYYGMPVKEVEKLKRLNSDVLGLFANEKYISKEIIEAFAANMKTAGKELTYKIFDAAHGFANPSNPKHDAEKSKEAYGMALKYLKTKFKLS